MIKIAVFEQGISGGSDNAPLSECRRCGQLGCIGGRVSRLLIDGGHR